MSELLQTSNSASIRWKLLTGASVLALTVYVASAKLARAEDADRPSLWIQLGGQMELMQGTSSPFTAPFMTAITPTPEMYGKKSFGAKQQPPRFAFGADGKLTFQPQDSDWIFSASIRYGRSHSKRHTHYQSSGKLSPQGGYFTSSGGFAPLPSLPPRKVIGAEAFSDTKALYSEHHVVLDFSVGKDIGIGLFGRDGASSVGAGVRSVAFSQSSAVTIYARPQISFANSKYPTPLYIPKATFNEYTLTGHTQRSFKGVGPSFLWNASAGLAGNRQDGELMLDWGVNAALLFGRQKAKTDHSTLGSHFFQGTYYHAPGYTPLYPSRNRNNPLRSRRVTVPNVGGFAGISMKWTNAKISVGYRGDIFFKAIDRGVDVQKDSNLTFNGPYASLSIGLGD